MTTFLFESPDLLNNAFIFQGHGSESLVLGVLKISEGKVSSGMFCHACYDLDVTQHTPANIGFPEQSGGFCLCDQTRFNSRRLHHPS